MHEDAFTVQAVASWLGLVALSVFIGCFLGRLVELRGWMKFAAFLARPIVKLGRLPQVGGAAFLTAFASNPAAQGMLATSCKEGSLTRLQMFCCGILNSFPAKLSHLLRTVPRILALLGLVAVAYISIQVAIDLAMVACALLLARLYGGAQTPEAETKETEKELPSWKDSLQRSLKSSLRSLLRVMLVAAPAYIIVMWLSKEGVFDKAEAFLPEFMREVFSKDVIKIIFAKMGGLTGSAAVAAKLIKSGSATQAQALLALVAANLLTIPFTTLRRNIPVALGIFPGFWGLWIVLTSQGFRILLNVVALLILIVWGAR